MIELHADPDRVEAQWLTAVLRSSGAVGGRAEIASVTRSRIGTGKLGDNVRFELTWAGDANGEPNSIVGKFAATDPTSRQAGLMTGIYLREIRFYQVLADRVHMRIPRCHFADIDTATGAFVVIMEDISPAHPGNQVDACGVDEAALAMEQLALLHGGMWNSPTLTGLDWLTARSENGGEGLAALYAALVPQFLGRYADRLSERAAVAAERFSPLVGA